jgi:hypothetical protein
MIATLSFSNMKPSLSGAAIVSTAMGTCRKQLFASAAEQMR